MDLSRRKLLSAAASSVFLRSGLARASEPDAEALPPNVLYISADQHNPLFTSHENHPLVRTPNIDRLVSQGMRCTNTYVATPVCAPTRQSWLTGLYAQEHGQLGNHYAFDPRNRTLVELFKQAGYTTACFGKLHTENEEHSGTLGFDVVMNQRDTELWRAVSEDYDAKSGAAPYYDPHDAPIFESIPARIPFKGRVKPDLTRCDDYVLAREASRFIKDSYNRPFFTYVSFRFPHYPFDLPEDFYYRHSPGAVGDPDLPETDWSARPGGALQMALQGWKKLTREQSCLLTARYMGAVEMVDHLVGMLLEAVDRAGLARNTLVIYSSDHGDMAGAKGLWLKHVMYEGAARKPFIMRLPGVLPAKSQWDGLLNDTDLLPTVAGLVGLGAAVPEDISGQDRSSAILENKRGATATFAVDHIQPDLSVKMTMVRTERYKYIHYPPGPDGKPSSELYDLLTDPKEMFNLAQDPENRVVMEEHEAMALRFLSNRRKPKYPLLPLTESSDPE